MGRISEYINGHRGRSTYLNSSSRQGSSGGGGMGVKFSVNSDAIELQVKQIESMMTDNPELRKKLQDAIREDVWKARNTVVSHMTGIFANGDPAEARRAVRNIVYEKILGANLNIMNMKKGTAQWKVRQIDRKVEQNPKILVKCFTECTADILSKKAFLLKLLITKQEMKRGLKV